MEYWDIYDQNKQRTGRLMRRDDWILTEGEYHLTVLAVLRRPDGRFLITRRAPTKAWGPGLWEVPGGGVLAGEDSLPAAIREVREETGLDVSGCAPDLSFTYHQENPGKGDNYFVDVYRFTLDFAEEDLHLQTEEVDGFRLAGVEEIRALGEADRFLHYESIRTAFSPDP